MISHRARTSHGLGARRASQPGTAPTALRTSAWRAGGTGTAGTMHSPHSRFAAAAGRPILLPLDGGRRLRRDVVDDAVHALHLVDDAAREPGEEIAGQPRPIGRHAVGRGDGADGDHVLVGALVAHDADRLDRQEDGERLPEVAVEAGRADLLLDDRVRPAQDREPLGIDGADDAHGEPGARERLAGDDLLGDAQHAPQVAHLVLEQLAQRLEQLEAHALGKTAHVVVALDGGGRAAHRYGLDDVRVERPLGEEGGVGDLPGLLLEHLDEGDADGAPLALGVLDVVQVLEETGRGIDVAHVELHGVAEDPQHLLGLAGAQEAIVDEDAGEPLADGTMDERGGHRRVDAAREPADDAPGAHPLADARHPRLGEAAHRPLGLRTAHAQHEVAEDLLPVDRVRHLGMELEAVDGALAVTVSNASGSVAIWSPWLIHTRVERPPRASSGSKRVMRRSAGPYSLRTARFTSPPKAWPRTFIP